MLHGESRLIHGMSCRISYRIDMFLLECDGEMLSEHCRHRVDTGGRRSYKAMNVKRADMWPL